MNDGSHSMGVSGAEVGGLCAVTRGTRQRPSGVQHTLLPSRRGHGAPVEATQAAGHAGSAWAPSQFYHLK